MQNGVGLVLAGVSVYTALHKLYITLRAMTEPRWYTQMVRLGMVTLEPDAATLVARARTRGAVIPRTVWLRGTSAAVSSCSATLTAPMGRPREHPLPAALSAWSTTGVPLSHDQRLCWRVRYPVSEVVVNAAAVCGSAPRARQAS
jgi:hypothetical protein